MKTQLRKITNNQRSGKSLPVALEYRKLVNAAKKHGLSVVFFKTNYNKFAYSAHFCITDKPIIRSTQAKLAVNTKLSQSDLVASMRVLAKKMESI